MSTADLATTITVLDACARASVAAILWGDPGIGKSALLNAVAAVRGVSCEVVYGSIREPADIAGLPVLGDVGVRLEPPRWAKSLASAEEGVVLFDELSTCAPATQAAMLGVLLDGQVDDLRLPEGVQRVGGDQARRLRDSAMRVLTAASASVTRVSPLTALVMLLTASLAALATDSGHRITTGVRSS